MSEILAERSGNILRVTVNRPEKKNAMTSAMYIALAEAFNEAAKDPDVNVVIWDAVGDSFSAGNDVKDFLNNPPGPGASPQALLADALLNLDKPVVAAVKGAAVGGGTTLLTHCDFVFAGESAKFQVPFVNLGLVPEFGSSFSLPANLGYIRAAELFMLGQPFDAKVASEIGLVTRVVPDDQLADVVNKTAEKLAAKPSGSLRAIKRLLKRGSRDQVEETAKTEGAEFFSRLNSPEAKEAFTAFLEKRPPNFSKVKE
ncbi:MAG TPA: enoyl-CoA hydratase, partial [Pyrinomonadaceae bacterium]|nr:enoyl-CoA hydratase [Pyrinomonadaceae bacterium]